MINSAGMQDVAAPRPFEEIWCLTMFDRDGGIVGFFYHPNRAAIDEKVRELGHNQAIGPAVYGQVVDRYVLARGAP